MRSGVRCVDASQPATVARRPRLQDDSAIMPTSRWRLTHIYGAVNGAVCAPAWLRPILPDGKVCLDGKRARGLGQCLALPASLALPQEPFAFINRPL